MISRLRNVTGHGKAPKVHKGQARRDESSPLGRRMGACTLKSKSSLSALPVVPIPGRITPTSAKPNECEAFDALKTAKSPRPPARRSMRLELTQTTGSPENYPRALTARGALPSQDTEVAKAAAELCRKEAKATSDRDLRRSQLKKIAGSARDYISLVQAKQCDRGQTLADALHADSTLGKGSFARVELVRLRNSFKIGVTTSGTDGPTGAPDDMPACFALKRVPKAKMRSEHDVERIMEERTVLSEVSGHAFVLNFFGSCQDEHTLYILTEYAPGGELYIQLCEAGTFTVEQGRFYTACLVLALHHLHESQPNVSILHRDIKAENVLFDASGHVKLADFGFAKRLPRKASGANPTTRTFVGTPDYLPPELLRRSEYTKAADWWSLGVLTYEMLTGHTPFCRPKAKKYLDPEDPEGNSQFAVFRRILLCQYELPPTFFKPPRVPDGPAAADEKAEAIGIRRNASDLISGLLTIDANARLGTRNAASKNDVAAHPWFAGFDFEALYERRLTPPMAPRAVLSDPREGDNAFLCVHGSGYGSEGSIPDDEFTLPPSAFEGF